MDWRYSGNLNYNCDGFNIQIVNQPVKNFPTAYPDYLQKYHPTQQNPYPMNFVQAPSFDHQILVNYNGQPMLQSLSVNGGPQLCPVRNINGGLFSRNSNRSLQNINQSQVAYPLSHSVLDPCDRSYLKCPYCVYNN